MRVVVALRDQAGDVEESAVEDTAGHVREHLVGPDVQAVADRLGAHATPGAARPHDVDGVVAAADVGDPDHVAGEERDRVLRPAVAGGGRLAAGGRRRRGDRLGQQAGGDDRGNDRADETPPAAGGVPSHGLCPTGRHPTKGMRE